MSTLKLENIKHENSSTNNMVMNSNGSVSVTNNATVGGTLGITGATTASGTLTSTGLITASSGVAIGGTGAANTLDDYEEGTFTPTITFGGASVSITYHGSRRFGKYTKIGNLVEYYIHVEMANKGSSSGGLNITGLPFTVVGNQHYIPSSVFIQQMSGLTAGAPVFRAMNGGTTMDCYQISSSTYSQITNSNCTNTSGFQINGKYFVS